MTDIDDMLGQAEALLDTEEVPDDLFAEDEETEAEVSDVAQFDENLAGKLSRPQEDKIVNRFMDLLKNDEESNSLSRKLYDEGLKRTGLSKEAPGGASFDGASRAVHPVMAEAAIDFQSRMLKELLPPDGPVKMQIKGKYTKEKWQRAKRKERKLNEQFTKDIVEFKPAMQQIMAQVSLNGDQYMKFWYDESYRRIRCAYVPSDYMLIPSSCVSFYSAERTTEIVPLSSFDFKAKVKSGFYLDTTLDQEPVNAPFEDGQTSPAETSKKIIGLSDDAEITKESERWVYEIHSRVDWDAFDMEDFDPLVTTDFPPYIIHIDATEHHILGMYRDWAEVDEDQHPKTYYVQWGLIPWRGPKAIGLVQLIGSLSGALTGIVRALLDSAHIQNAPTSLKLKFGKATTKNYNIEIGQVNEYEAETGITDIRSMFMPLPFNPPSPTLYSLLGDLYKLARGVIKTSFEELSETNANVPVGTTLNKIEQGMVVFSSIFERFHETQQRVIDVVSRLNFETMEDDELTHEDEENDVAVREDFKDTDDVQPVSNPRIFSSSQRFAQVQMALSLASQAPQLYNIRELHKMALEFGKVPNIEGILPEPEDQKDENPVTENVKMAMGSPAFALPDQDHMAHLECHMKFLESPLFSSPSYQAKAYPIMLEHLKQHVLMHYASVAADLATQALGLPIEAVIDDDPGISEDISRLLAVQTDDVIKKTEDDLKQVMGVIAKLEQIVGQIQPQMPMDPAQAAIQVAQMDNQTKQQDISVKAQKNQGDQQLKQAEIEQKGTIEEDKNALKALELASKEEISDEANQTKILANVQDNQTAMDISALKAVTGKPVGNLQNGDGLDPGNGV